LVNSKSTDFKSQCFSFAVKKIIPKFYKNEHAKHNDKKIGSRNDMMPLVHCPKCGKEHALNHEVLIAQSNQNVIYRCESCGFEVKDIQTSKG